MMIECDENMILHLLRNWHPNRLRSQGFRLANERPRLIAMQNDVCPVCRKPLVNDGKVTHIDHIVTVKEFTDKVLKGELTFDEAYCQLWEDSNLRAVHRGCNYNRNVGRKKATERLSPVARVVEESQKIPADDNAYSQACCTRDIISGV
jgi:hypothetical protein